MLDGYQSKRQRNGEVRRARLLEPLSCIHKKAEKAQRLPEGPQTLSPSVDATQGCDLVRFLVGPADCRSRAHAAPTKC